MARYPPPSLPPPPLSPLTHCEGLEQTNNGSDGDDFDPMYVVGVSLAALSALISSVALLIMKRSADTEAGLPLRPSCTHRWRRLWWLGFLMNTGSEVSLSVVALGMAPISVIAPIFGLAIVFSAVLARLGWVPGVKESLSRAEWASIVVIVVGIGLCSAFGPSTEHEIAFEDIGKFFGRASFLGYACPAAAFVLFWVAVLLPRSPLLWLRPGSRYASPPLDHSPPAPPPLSGTSSPERARELDSFVGPSPSPSAPPPPWASRARSPSSSQRSSRRPSSTAGSARETRPSSATG
mmetsp:Transcript_37131/g.122507  ORF Transcript_37131/g.122507 Transcript_37131/m.122507 type:complete len:293 (-) Transcript_37131:697-1575(-)